MKSPEIPRIFFNNSLAHGHKPLAAVFMANVKMQGKLREFPHFRSEFSRSGSDGMQTTAVYQ